MTHIGIFKFSNNKHRLLLPFPRSSYTLQMVPERSTGGLGFHHVQLQVPADVWGMDLTFTDQKDVSVGESVWGMDLTFTDQKDVSVEQRV